MTVVLNTNPYTYLGNRPFNLAPDAGFDRGLAVVTVRTMKVLPFLSIAASALRSGQRLRKSKNVDYRTDVEAVALVADPAHGADALPGRRRPPRRRRSPRVQPRAQRPPPRPAVTFDWLRSAPTARPHTALEPMISRATAGTFVQRPSTPRARSSVMRLASSTVQTLTFTPAAWHRVTRSSSTNQS